MKLAIALPILTAACTASGTEDPAVAQFTSDFEQSRYSAAVADSAALDAAATRTGDDVVTLHAGLAHLWHLAELPRGPAPDPAAVPGEVMATLAAFQQAQALRPDDLRLYCWLGGMRVIAGSVSQNSALVDQGMADLNEGARVYPQFNQFCVALAFKDFPAGSPQFDGAVEAMYGLYDSCVGGHIDRDRPDITPFLGKETHEGPTSVCWSGPKNRHSLEGSFLFFGDLLVKQGKLDAARAAYASAKAVPTYATWPYRGWIDDRLGADLSARAALYRDSDPSNDPPLLGDGKHNCTGCHASNAGEP